MEPKLHIGQALADKFASSSSALPDPEALAS